MPIAIVSLAGLALFVWPFTGTDLPASTPAWTLTLACIGGLLLVEAGECGLLYLIGRVLRLRQRVVGRLCVRVDRGL